MKFDFLNENAFEIIILKTGRGIIFSVWSLNISLN